MGCTRAVGRFGGMAAALGIGAAALSGSAWADDAPGPQARADPTPGAVAAAGTRPARTPKAAASTHPGPARRPHALHHLPAARAGSPNGTAARSTARKLTSTLTVDPRVDWQDGVLRATVGATSSQPLGFTLVSQPSLGGKLGSDTATNQVIFGPSGQFSYLPYSTTLTDTTKTESFSVLVAENTRFDRFLTSIPLLGLLAQQGLQILHRTPVLGTLLAPVIGSAQTVTFDVKPSVVAAGRPTAFTNLMPSFDSTPISINYFPALNVARGETSSAPTVLMSPGLPGPGDTDLDNPYGQMLSAVNQFGSLTPGIPLLRSDSWISPDGGPDYRGGGGYNVITWDPRGEYASGGVLQLDSPFYEGRDVSAIISWTTSSADPARSQIALEDAVSGDPLIGMVGGSYGGGIQLAAAGTDPRIDAIVPQLAWNSLVSSLYPNDNQFKTAMGAGLVMALAVTGAHINAQIYRGVITGVTVGLLSPTSQAALASSGPTVLLNRLDAPTLLFQGMQDVLFPLSQAVANAQHILANADGTPVKMAWFCGGHGTCLDPLNPYQDDLAFIDNLIWLDAYVAGTATPDAIPAFQWYDQLGARWSSDLLPFQEGFNSPDPYTATDAGGLLGIVPVLGGSGPYPLNRMPYSIANAGPARNALVLKLSPPVGSQIVGAPVLDFSYSGLGTSRTVYAQLVDDATGRVIGNIVTPVPVTLDGRARSVTIPMEDIGYTTPAGDSLTLQITSSAAGLENFTSFGLIRISGIGLALPIRAATDPRL